MSGAFLDGAPGPTSGPPQQPAPGSFPSGPWSWDGATSPQPNGVPAGGPSAGRGTVDITRSAARGIVAGWRGLATVTAIRLRWVAAIAAIGACSLITEAAVTRSATPMPGGMMMWMISTTMLVAASVGSLFSPAHRHVILEQLRHYLFGMSVFPATGIAVLMYLVRDVAAESAVRGEVLGTLLGTPLIAVFLATLIVPAGVFIRLVAASRTLHRSGADDEEVMRTWSRADRFMP